MFPRGATAVTSLTGFRLPWPMVDPDPEEAARRLRAAIAYVGLSQDGAMGWARQDSNLDLTDYESAALTD
jgi:hypothetical protein